jgi:DNA-binding PadR family transcriptional regulator
VPHYTDDLYSDHLTSVAPTPTPTAVPRARTPDDALPLSPLSLAILIVLAEGARHGYAIIKALEVETEGRIVPGAGTLYAALQRMTDDALIAETAGGGDTPDDARRRYYALTPFGRDVARAELRRLERMLALRGARRLLPTLRVSPGPSGAGGR